MSWLYSQELVEEYSEDISSVSITEVDVKDAFTM